MVNLHFSLLPRWRGAAPVERALLAGDAETGVCVMQLEEGLDTGPVFARREVPIGARTTADELRAELVAVGTDLLVVAARARGLGQPDAAGGRGHVRGQDRPGRARASTGTARPIELDRLVRLGGAWTTFRGQRLKVLAAEPWPSGLATASRRPGELDGARGRDGRRRARAARGAARGQGPPMPFAALAQRRPARRPGERLGA